MNYPKPTPAKDKPKQMYVSVPGYNTNIKFGFLSGKIFFNDKDVSRAVIIGTVTVIALIWYNKFIKNHPKVKKPKKQQKNNKLKTN